MGFRTNSHYFYSVGRLKSIAGHYDERKQLAYSGCRGWTNLIIDKADFDTALVAISKKWVFERWIAGNSVYGLCYRDFREMTKCLNRGVLWQK